MLKKYWLLLGVFCTAWAMAEPNDINKTQDKAVYGGRVNIAGQYPQQALESGFEGEVQVLITVLPTGEITNIKMAKSSGHPVLDRSARRSARNVRIQLMRLNGQAVQTQYRIHVMYRLTPEKCDAAKAKD